MTTVILLKHIFSSLRQITAFISLLALFGSTFNKALILTDYELNRKFIANVLCENKDKPKSCCMGKCYLKKKLARQENNDSPKRESNNPVGPDWIWTAADFNVQLIKTSIVYDRFPAQHLPLKLSRPVFHPPGTAFAYL